MKRCNLNKGDNKEGEDPLYEIRLIETDNEIKAYFEFFQSNLQEIMDAKIDC